MLADSACNQAVGTVAYIKMHTYVSFWALQLTVSSSLEMGDEKINMCW